MKKTIAMTMTAIALSLPGFAAADLDARGDRIENRLDNKGDRIENRLDNRGDRIENKLDRRADRAAANGNDRRAAALTRNCLYYKQSIFA